MGGGAAQGTESAGSARAIWQVRGIARVADGRVALLSSEKRPAHALRTLGRAVADHRTRGPRAGRVRPPAASPVPPARHARGMGLHDGAGQLLRHGRNAPAVEIARSWQNNSARQRHRRPERPPNRCRIAVDSTGRRVVRRRRHAIRPGLGAFPGQHGAQPPPWSTCGSTRTTPPKPLLRGKGEQIWFPEPELGVPMPDLPTFLHDSHVAAGGSPLRIYTSDGDWNEIHQYSLDGDLVRVIRRTTDPVPVTRSAHRAWQEGLGRFFSPLGDADAPDADEVFRRVPRPEKFPSVAALLVDLEGYLWVREWVGRRNRNA